MRYRIIQLLLFVSILLADCAFGQEIPPTKDTLVLYKKIESFSERSKFTKLIYQSLFKPISIVPKEEVKQEDQNKIIYREYEGKIIRNIHILTLDPFGNSVHDTVVQDQSFLSKAANHLHRKSRRLTIRNLLLIKRNQSFDSLLVQESERLVRSASYVNDVSFSFAAASPNSDSVDIYIRELDTWSLILDGASSLSSSTVYLSDRNFLGLGHEFQNEYKHNYTNGKRSYSTTYSIPNIDNTFISSALHYKINEDNYFDKSINVDRPFFSPYARWGAGIFLAQQYKQDSIRTNNSRFELLAFKSNTQDYWAGYAFQIFKGNTETDRTTNFISSARFYKIRYLEKPVETENTMDLFSDEDFYLASIGISSRKYIQDKYIFKYGLTEYVPIGRVYSLTVGYQKKDELVRPYFGTRISVGNYHSWGYLASNMEYGFFMHNSRIEQGVFTASLTYFTRLFEIGKWKFRQFAKPEITFGINQIPSNRISLNDGFGLNGFNSSVLVGTSRFLFTLQIQSYSPWNFIGFHFGPYLNYSLGMLGDDANGFQNSKAYSQIGLGVIIRNEHLIFSTFQISVAFYPSIPGDGNNVFKLNSFKTTDFGFRDYEIGKPSTVPFH